MLGGYDWLKEFHTERLTTVYLTGVSSDIFFDIVERGNESGIYFQRVKPVVTEARKSSSSFRR